MPDLAGVTLGRYRVLDKLGAGGMGEVWRAQDTLLDREVAIKVLPEAVASDPERLARFDREVRAVAALSHPNVLAIHDFGTDRGITFAVTELLRGETLGRLLASGPLPVARTLGFAGQIAAGLAAAHDRGIVHRDLKPENIFVLPDGRIKILDFGLARMEEPASPEVVTEDLAPLLTRTGAVLGTVGYMAPEQLRGEPADHRTDIFAFGCVLYEMLTGASPFPGNSATEIGAAVLTRDPLPPDDIDPALERIVVRCLAKRPKDRFQSVHDLAFGLENAAAPAPASPAASAPAHRRGAHTAVLVVAAFVVVAAAVVALRLAGVRAGATPADEASAIRSIAVLPLANFSGDPKQEYFADGMTEALITGLAQIGSLDVISRTSVMRYKGTKKPLPEIARELGVDAVLEGSVTRDPEKVRITVQLIRGATDRHLWTESYDRPLRNVLDLQSEVARDVAKEIDIALTPDEQRRLTRSRPVDPRAHDVYLRGFQEAQRLTGKDLAAALVDFQQAIDLDPGFAEPYAGLGMVYGNMTYTSGVPPRKAFPKARAAGERALELDPELALARTLLGWVALVYDWDWRRAEAECRRGVELAPGSSGGHQILSYVLSATGRQPEAIAEVRRAAKLDPLSAIAGQQLGMAFYLDRRYDEAEAQLETVTTLYPRFWLGFQRLAITRMAKGDLEAALEAAQTAFDLAGAGTVRRDRATLASLYALTGRKAEALALLREMRKLARPTYVPPTDFARVFVALGERERAIQELEKAYEVRDGDMFMLGVLPYFDPLRDDPRFQEIIRRMAFPKR